MAEQTENTYEIDFPYETEERNDRAAMAVTRLLNCLGLERLEAIAEFIEEYPEEVEKAEKWIRNPPTWMKPFI